MKSILFFLLFAYSLSCSDELEMKQTPGNRMDLIESPSANSLQSKPNLNHEHISGRGETHISGVPLSSNISGQ